MSASEAVTEIVVVLPAEMLLVLAVGPDEITGLLFETVTSEAIDIAVPSDFKVSAFTCPVPCAEAVNKPLVSRVPTLPVTDQAGETVINFRSLAFPLASTPYTVNCCVSFL